MPGDMQLERYKEGMKKAGVIVFKGWGW